MALRTLRSVPIGDIALAVATVLAAVYLGPQIWRLWHTRNPDGVSPTWACFGTVINAAWIVYLVAEELWPALVATVIVVASYLTTAYLVLRLRPRAAPGAIGRAAIVAVGLTLVAVLFGWTALGIVLGLSYGLQVAPSVWSAYAVDDPAGISLPTWWLGLAQAVLWGIYAVGVADAGIITYAVIGVVSSAAIIGRVTLTRRPRPVPATGAAPGT